MSKAAIRQALLSTLKSQDRLLKVKRDQQLLSQFVKTKLYQESQVIATYLSFDFEYDTSFLIQQAIKDGKEILIPKIYDKGEMIFCPYDSERLKRTSFGLLEPLDENPFPKEMIDLIHVPGLAFNAAGYRIGFGGGYYDRYLSDYTGETVSLIYDFQRVYFAPERFDQPVRKVIVNEK